MLHSLPKNVSHYNNENLYDFQNNIHGIVLICKKNWKIPISNQIRLSVLKVFSSRHKENSESQNYCVFLWMWTWYLKWFRAAISDIPECQSQPNPQISCKKKNQEFLKTSETFSCSFLTITSHQLSIRNSISLFFYWHEFLRIISTV